MSLRASSGKPTAYSKRYLAFNVILNMLLFIYAVAKDVDHYHLHHRYHHLIACQQLVQGIIPSEESQAQSIQCGITLDKKKNK